MSIGTGQTPLRIAHDPPAIRIDESGNVRVGPTRVTLVTVLFHFNEGASPEEIVSRFPSLKLADVYSAIGYYLRHKPEVDEFLADTEWYENEVARRLPSVSREGFRAPEVDPRTPIPPRPR